MTNWQITATTIYCNAIDDDVTIQVYKDWSVKCCSYDKYHQPGKELLKLLKQKSQQLSRPLECTGPQCSYVIQYKDKLFAEEMSKEHER